MDIEVPKEQAPVTLRAFLPRALPDAPVWALQECLRRRDVRRGGERLGGTDEVAGGDLLRVYLPKTALKSAPGQLQVVYEDAHVLLVNKPQGISVCEDEGGGDTMLARAQRHIAAEGGDAGAVALCHRLDHHTGGLLLLAKDAAALEAAKEAFRLRTIHKTYTCRVVGCPQPREQVLLAYLRKDAARARVQVAEHPFPGAQRILTGYRVVEEEGDASRLEVDLITGRTHQIRAHLAFIGHPIIGDDKYGLRAVNRAQHARGQQLWATRLELHARGALAYLDGRSFEVKAPF